MSSNYPYKFPPPLPTRASFKKRPLFSNWDAENRLISMESIFDNYFVPGLPRNRLTFSYDFQGRRIETSVFDWNYTTTSFQLTSTTKFIYDLGWNLLAEKKSTQTSWRTYLWGADLSGTIGGAGGIGGLLVENDPTQGVLLTAYDGNGNLKALLKVSDGAIAAAYEYGPFGELLRATGAMARGNPFRWSTKYCDAETGFCYYGYRFYDSNKGRWINRDPIGERGGKNVMAFIGNTISQIDRYGLAAEAYNTSATVTPSPEVAPGSFHGANTSVNWDLDVSISTQCLGAMCSSLSRSCLSVSGRLNISITMYLPNIAYGIYRTGNFNLYNDILVHERHHEALYSSSWNSMISFANSFDGRCFCCSEEASYWADVVRSVSRVEFEWARYENDLFDQEEHKNYPLPEVNLELPNPNVTLTEYMRLLRELSSLLTHPVRCQ